MCGKSASLESPVSKEQIALGSVFPSDLASDREYLGSPADRRTREACPHHKYQKFYLQKMLITILTLNYALPR